MLRYLKSPEAMRPKPRSRRGSKLDPYTEHIDRRLGDGLENCVVLLRELRDLGYDGSNTILSEYVRPRRRRRQEATMRFETAPGEQAQVDWGSLGADGKQRRVWVFVNLGWSRACYVELVRKADTAALPRQCLRVSGRCAPPVDNATRWAETATDLEPACWISPCGWVLRLGCANRAQTKGKVENGVKYVRRVRFTDDVDLNRQGLEWCDVVANARVGTTHRVPWEMLAAPPGEAARSGHAGAVPARCRLGGGAPGHGGDLGWSPGASPGNSPSSASWTSRGRGGTPLAGSSWWREVWHDRSGAPVPGNPQAGRGGFGQHPGPLQPAVALSRDGPNFGVEVAARRERYRLVLGWPICATFQRLRLPALHRRLVKELANLAFVAEGTNVLLLGPPGVGKTHLAIALALRAIENGHGAYFVRAYDLMEDLRKARAEHNLDRRMKVYLAPKVLVVDEFGIWPYDRESATAFFTLVSARYERGSIILTSNKGFGEWGELLGDSVIASAVLDRLIDDN